jgi:hypothetical protein
VSLPSTRAARASLACAVALLSTLPSAAAALEPRFDHRDTHGPLVSLAFFRDSGAIPGRATAIDWRPALRLAGSVDLVGDGDEFIFGATTRLGGWSDPDRTRTLLALDARYRGYFGTEEWKTFFEVGAWTQLRSRFSVGPLASLGVAYDHTRDVGVFVSLELATGFGAERVASVGGTVGAQFRFQ